MKKRMLFSFIGLLFAILAVAQDRTVTGKVTNEDTGEPLSGVSIRIKGERGGTVTDANGHFSLKIPSRNNSMGKWTILFSYSGFNERSIPLDGTDPLEVRLKNNDRKLDEVVVIGYGTVKKRDLTGSVVSVKGDEVRKVPAANLMESVQGKVAGVDIVRTSGAAGASVSVAVRGDRSIIAEGCPARSCCRYGDHPCTGDPGFYPG
jgi:hypothetical protein